MDGKKKFFLYAGLISVFMICASLTYLCFGGLLPDRWGKIMLSSPAGNNKPTISKDTVINEEIRYSCGDKTISVQPAGGDLVGLDWKGLRNKFPVAEGWVIDDSVKGKIIFIKEEKELCPKHRNYRHLGFSQGFLAVFEGPLENNERVLSQEDIKAEDLPADLREELEKVEGFNGLDAASQEELRREYEFVNEQKLNEWLENLDEYRAE